MKLIRICLLVLLASLASAQTSVVLMPLPRFFWVDSTGSPLNAGCVFSYQAGTTTPQVTYTDSTGSVANADPVVLDSNGSASIWLATGLSYKIAVYTAGSPPNSTCSNGSIIWSQDNVNGPTAPTMLNVDASAHTVNANTTSYQIFPNTYSIAAGYENTLKKQFQVHATGTLALANNAYTVSVNLMLNGGAFVALNDVSPGSTSTVFWDLTARCTNTGTGTSGAAECSIAILYYISGTPPGYVSHVARSAAVSSINWTQALTVGIGVGFSTGSVSNTSTITSFDVQQMN